jgi:hypothetical protein
VALQADLLFTPVNTCSVYSLEALQANFEDPFVEPPTGEWERKQLSLSINMIYVLIYSRIKRKYANQAKV